MVYPSGNPQGDLNSKWQGPFKIILLTPTVAKLEKVTSWVHLSRLKQVTSDPALPSLTYQVPLTGPTSLKKSPSDNLCRPSKKTLNDLDTLQPTAVPDPITTRPLDQRPDRTSFEDLTMLVSQLWLQGTFYNLTPDEIDFFTLILYIILHSNEHCSSSDSSNHQGPSAPCPDWPLPI